MLERLSLLAAVALLPAVALAHGPTRQKVAETVEIALPADKVWARIGKFDDLSWMPAVAKTEGTGGNEVGATRHVILKGEGSPTLDEELLSYDAAAMTYGYKITKVDVNLLPVNTYSSHLTVTALDGGRSQLEWRGAFYRGYPNNDPPPELNDDAAIAAVNRIYRTTLDALKTNLEGAK